MKVLHVIPSLEIGGAQRLLVDLLPIINKDCKSEVLVMYSAENVLVRKLKEQGIPIHSLERKNIYNLLNILRIKKRLKGYDIIHVHLFPVEYWVPLASWFNKTKLVYTEHSTSNRRRAKKVFKFIDRFIYARYDKIISISPGTQDSLINWLHPKINDNRFIVINNGVDITRFYNIHDATISTKDKTSLMMISRFTPAKDQKTVIRAMAHLDDNYHLYLVGDGSLLNETEAYAQDLGLGERVTFLGAKDNIPELISSCDIGIQSSNWEGFGLTAIEMMAAGKPVIASDIKGLNVVVSGAGLLFKRGDDRQLAELIKHVSEDKDEYNKISQRCIIRSHQYDIRFMVEEYLKVYKSLLNVD